MNDTFRSDRIFGIFIILFALLLGWLSYTIEFNPLQFTLSARFFPLLLAGVLFFLGLAMILKPRPTPLKSSVDKVLNPKWLALGLLIAMYFMSFRYLDFRLGAWLFMLLSMRLLGSKKFWELAVIPVVVSLFVYLLFRHGFTVLLPVWI